MGDLDNWMDETFVKSLFNNSTGDTVNVKIIRDRSSGYVLLFLFLNAPLPIVLLPSRIPTSATSF